MSTGNGKRRTFNERLSALHQASLELVQDISLESLLERISKTACQLLGASFAAVGVMGDDGELERFITSGMSEEEVKGLAHPPKGIGLLGELMHTNKPLRVNQLDKDPRSTGFPAGHPIMTSFLGVPIQLGDHQVGHIYITNKENKQPFNDEDQELIEILASYAGVAISNARLYRELVQRDRVLTRRNENLALLNQLASTLAASTDSDQILEKALDQVMEYLRLDIGEIYLRQEDSKTLRLVLHRGRTNEPLFDRDHYQLGHGTIGQTASSGQPRLFKPKDAKDINAAAPSDICQIGCFPLAGRSGALGVLCVGFCSPHPIDDLEMQFLTAISAWVGTVIENVRLSLQGRRLAILEERERIGMDLHDGIIQSIYAVGLTLEHARLLLEDDPDQARHRIAQSIDDLNAAIRDIRAYILDLRPRHLLDESLMQGVQRLVHEFRTNTMLEVNLKGPADGLETLPVTQAVALFHICQEALANIAKHARAANVDVVLWATADRALLEVHDDGRGFDLEKVKLTIGHGLSNMHTRARNAGGDVDISTEPGSGTTVLAWVPFGEE
ncbi:MAG TPA: GAF domain-containing sensor histidine kinase [Longilinea sp.]|nr:GAF domain-containing sensor histidine kinase [Longilinea sp.]